MVSHKLRTPLNGMVSILELMETEFAGGEHAELVKMAADSARRLHLGVEEILTFASLSSREAHEEIYPLADLSGLIERLRAELKIEQLDAVISPALASEKIALSALELETVCREILENASKFHPTQTPTIQFTAELSPGRHLFISIVDDGVHLSPDQLAQVWIPYYQGEKHITGEVAGMGLGLSVVKSTIVSKGGGITLRNNSHGPGIQVLIDLPLVG